MNKEKVFNVVEKVARGIGHFYAGTLALGGVLNILSKNYNFGSACLVVATAMEGIFYVDKKREQQREEFHKEIYESAQEICEELERMVECARDIDTGASNARLNLLEPKKPSLWDIKGTPLDYREMKPVGTGIKPRSLEVYVN